MKIKSFMRLKLSTRLQRALDDLKAVEKDKKNFVVDMKVWAAQGQTDDEGEIINQDICAVCHAGSVLAKSINGPLFKELMEAGRYEVGQSQLYDTGEDPDIINDFEQFLRGVNSLRTNDLFFAAHNFGLDIDFFDDFKYEDRHIEYEYNPTSYKKWFQLVVNYVERKGL